ncbi:MAG: cellulase family glycosylhydrolase [Clostridiales bacterium]|nr:cellulase family glycosylhydrolase [Clostridiales bacterium]
MYMHKTFRRFAAIIMTLVMAFSLAACGNSNSDSDAQTDITPSTEEVADAAEGTESQALTEEETEIMETTGNNVFPEAVDVSSIESALPGRVEVSGTDFVVNGETIYMNGVNTPWDNWNDFGGSYYEGFWSQHFAELAENGINATRIWITCDGTVGMIIDDDGYVEGATTQFWSNLDSLFTTAQENGIYIMATLMSFDHFKETNSTYETWRDMVQDEEKIESYVDNFVIPFVERYDGFDSLWSIDLCNEPDWIHENAEDGQLAWDDICNLFAHEAAAIHENSDVLVTVGFGMVKYNSDSYEGNYGSDEYLQSLYDNADAYLDFYSTHFYEWEAEWFGFPFDKTPTDFLLDGTKPCVIGEFPASGFDGSVKNSVEMSGSECYVNAYENGWNGAFAWTSNGVDSCGSLSDFADGANEVAAMQQE